MVGRTAGGVTDGEIECREYGKNVRKAIKFMSIDYHISYVSMCFQKDGMTQGCSVAASSLAMTH